MAFRAGVRRALVWAAAGFVGVQAVTIAGVLAWASHMRKLRPARPFPVLPPSPTPADESELTIYTYGDDLYKDMLEAIDAAEHTIYFETFIWKGDEVGQLFKDRLIAAADRGVRVYCVYDVFANLVVNPTFFRFPKNVEVHPHPLVGGGIAFFHPRNSGRDHRKLIVVDGKVGFLGGYNIGTLYATKWRDTHVRCTGPIVGELENAFIDYWNSAPGRPRHRLPDPGQRSWDANLRVHRNTPRHFVYPIRNMYLEAIDRASKHVWLTHAYLLPDADLTRALRDAARREVDVRIIVPARSNHVVADFISRGFYRTLLEAGVTVFLYQDAMIHAKTATIDGIWSTVGTANLDNLSLAGNYEINLEVISTDVAQRMEIFISDLSNCVPVVLAEWTRRHPLARVSEAILAPLRPLL